MTLADLIRRFRVLAVDTAEPYFSADVDVKAWLSDAQDQAAMRSRLLLEDENPGVCRITMTVGKHTYKLHASLYELVRLRYQSVADPTLSKPIKLVSREWLDANVPDWRDQQGEICYAIQGDTTIRLVGVPVEAGVLLIEGYRLPFDPLEDDGDEPEIHAAHHEKLIQWALHRAFSVPDADTFDPNRSAAAEAEFTRYFGPMPDANLRRITREDTPHVNVAYLP